MYKLVRIAAAGLAVVIVNLLPGQITETPATVAPGRFLIEMDALSLKINRDGGDRFTAWGVATTFLTSGLTANWDVQVGAELFLDQKFDSSGLTERNSGLGDVYFRTKWRFYADADTGTSIAIMPYVKLPTNTGGVGNQAREGGLIIPWEAALVGGVQLTAMGKIDFQRNDGDNGYDSFWSTSVALQRAVTQAIGLYAETKFGKSTSGAPWDGVVGGGVTLALSKNTVWDYALYRGLTSGSSDWQHVLRLNWGF